MDLATAPLGARRQWSCAIPISRGVISILEFYAWKNYHTRVSSLSYYRMGWGEDKKEENVDSRKQCPAWEEECENFQIGSGVGGPRNNQARLGQEHGMDRLSQICTEKPQGVQENLAIDKKES